jgi:L-asparagine oxygenase
MIRKTDVIRCTIPDAVRDECAHRIRESDIGLIRGAPHRQLLDQARCFRDRERTEIDQWELLARFTKELGHDLFRSAREQMRRFAKPNGPVVAIMENLPTTQQKMCDVLPYHGLRNPSQWDLTPDVIPLAGIWACDHYPAAFEDESGSELTMPVFPIDACKKEKTSKGDAPLDPHVDNAAFDFPFRPHALALYSVVNNQHVPTYAFLLSSAVDIMVEEYPEELYRLQESRYRFRTPLSFHLGDRKQVLSSYQPIIWTDDVGEHRIVYSGYSIDRESLDSASRNAVEALDLVLQDERVRIEVDLQPGMLMLISNTKCLHGRSQVRGTRFLTRAYGMEDLRPLRRSPKTADRPLKYRFSLSEFLKSSPVEEPLLVG